MSPGVGPEPPGYEWDIQQRFVAVFRSYGRLPTRLSTPFFNHVHEHLMLVATGKNDSFLQTLNGTITKKQNTASVAATMVCTNG